MNLALHGWVDGWKAVHLGQQVVRVGGLPCIYTRGNLFLTNNNEGEREGDPPLVVKPLLVGNNYESDVELPSSRPNKTLLTSVPI